MLVHSIIPRKSISNLSRHTILINVSHFRFSSTKSHPPNTFEAINVNNWVVRGLQKNFPHVKIPTATQEQFIPAILKGHDVLIQDRTGTGKSFGLLLALLSKPRATRRIMPKYWKDRATQKVTLKEAITSIIIVPHNDLARQFRQWVKTLDLTRELDSVVQTLLNDPEENYEEQIKRISKEVPHILVTTPKALEACWSVSQHLLTLDSVSTIVLEEADALLKIPSNNTPIAVQRKWRKHPPVTRELLDKVFQYRPKKVIPGPNEPVPVQLVVASATLRAAVRRVLFLETKWLSQIPGGTLTIEGTQKTDRREDTVRHYGLFVDITGSVRNVVGSEEDPTEIIASTSEMDGIDEQDGDDPGATDGTLSEVSNSNPKETRNRLPSQLLDAVVSTFVLDVPAYALLIIPSNVSVLRTVEDLTSLGVRAVNLDDYIHKPGETMHRLKKGRPIINSEQGKEDDGHSNESGTSSEPQATSTSDESAHTLVDDPIMLVAVQAAVRGIDLPIISHVFIAGVPESEVDYVHLSGRVGRMGAIETSTDNVKKVITFLPEPVLNRHLDRNKAMAIATKPKKDLERMWNMIGIKPSVYARAI